MATEENIHRNKATSPIVSSSSPPTTSYLARPPAISGHNRDVTEHTASLMSLFARPASPPKTPITPNLNDDIPPINLNVLNVPRIPWSTPSIGGSDEMEFQRISFLSRTSTKRDGNSESINAYSSSNGSFISSNNSLRDTIRVSNTTASHRDDTVTVQNLTTKENNAAAEVFACTPTRTNKASTEKIAASSLMELVTDPKFSSKDYSTFSAYSESSRLPFLKAISERRDKDDTTTAFLSNKPPDDSNSRNVQSFVKRFKGYISTTACDSKQMKTTFIGAILYSLYALVFCFAEASAITRPSHPNTEDSGLLAPMALMGCVATLVTAPVIISILGRDYPAPYPCLDMFLAPFLAQMATDIDEVLVQAQRDSESENTDMETFLATFVALNAFGMALSGVLCILASKVKLANLAGFLPYPVLCGFFSSVGISVWMSAFKVDTGVAVQKVLASGDIELILTEFVRHAPSLLVGAALYNYGPRNITFLIGIISSTVILAFLFMILTNHTLEEAQSMGYFWKSSEVVMANEAENLQLKWGILGPPTPLGLFFPSVIQCISWPAFLNGLNNTVAMSIIYLLRCSLHAAALRKNDAYIQEIIVKEQQQLRNSETSVGAVIKMNQEPTKRSQMSVLCVLNWYAYNLLALVLSGGFAVLPALSLGGIFARINAHTRLPQFTAMLILLVFYLTDFALVSYVPKFTFSSLLVMAAIDLVNSWFVRSYNKTAQLYEWLVIPFIVTASLLCGMLQALGMGVCISTFIFVAQFYRSGVVKFVATGLTIRSSIERSVEDSKWIDTNGDLIQILVLQNYLYFGNVQSCLRYVTTMFNDDDDDNAEDLPPIPKYVILDLSIVTGIDTSAVDVMGEISSLCKANGCRLLLSGIPPSVKPYLFASGLTPSRQNSHLFFMDDLDISLGKAEDDLLKFVAQNEERVIQDGKAQKHQRITSMIDNGVRYALRKIDEQHDLGFAKHLIELEKYTVPRELEPGESLNQVGSECLQRGLYFIESGLIKCSIDASASLTRGRQRASQFGTGLRRNDRSIGQMNARSGTLARNAAILKTSSRHNFENTFRLGRFGPGWVLGKQSTCCSSILAGVLFNLTWRNVQPKPGTISEFTGQEIPGTYTCLTPSRVHHLSFDTIEDLEINHPVLTLHLYKMLAHLMARRQEMTIGQLSTFRTIMASAPTKPMSRRSLIAVNRSVQSSA